MVTIANRTGVVLVDLNGAPYTISAGGTSMSDDAAFTAATSSFTPVGGIVTADAVDSGDGGAFAMLANRQQKITLYDSSGVEVTSFGGGTQYAVDTALGATPTGTLALAIRDDALSALTPVEGDAIGLRVDANGALWMIHSGALAVTQSGTWDEVGINDSGNSITVDNPQLSVVGGGVEATAMRVTIASDSTGVLSVDDNGGSLTVDNAGLTALNGAISGTEVQVDVVAALPAGTNAIGKLAANSGVDIGDVDVTSIAAGTNNIGNVGLIGRTSGGMSIFKSIDIDETEEDVKTSAGQVFSIAAFNHTAAPIYLKFYNATAANVTVGTTTPVLTFTVPGNADSDGAGFIWNNEIGFAFGTAICVAATTGIADNDTGAPAANACSVMVGYV